MGSMWLHRNVLHSVEGGGLVMVAVRVIGEEGELVMVFFDLKTGKMRFEVLADGEE